MSGAAAAAAAAAARRRQLEQQAEEEQMTNYAVDDLADGWEFKIVRANTPAFRNPKKLARLIESEAPAGWTMVEKFDDQRVRFKRPARARLRDGSLPAGVDPYRTHFGMPPTSYALMIVVLALAFAGAMIGSILLLVQ